MIALKLFTEQGFHETTVDQIASEAGVSRRTFFRYYKSKSDLLWNEFDAEIQALRDLLADMPDDIPVMEGLRRAVLAANRYGADAVPELRMRMSLLNTVPELGASATTHYDAWERAVSAYVAARSGQPEDSLYPLSVGRTVLAACRAAYERWSARADADLVVYLDASLRALAAGFTDEVLTAEPDPRTSP